MGLFFNIMTYIMGWGGMVVLAACLASGLYLLGELAEDNVGPTRKILKQSLIITLILHVIIWIDGVAAIPTSVGFICHLSLIPLLRSFPFVTPLSIPTALAIVAVMVNHVTWLNYLKDDFGTNESVVPTSPRSILGFFLFFVWLLPMGFFVSMTLVEDALPSAAATQGMMGDPMRNGAFGGPGGAGQKRVGAFKRMVDYLFPKEQRNEFYSSVSPGRGKTV